MMDRARSSPHAHSRPSGDPFRVQGVFRSLEEEGGVGEEGEEDEGDWEESLSGALSHHNYEVSEDDETQTLPLTCPM